MRKTAKVRALEAAHGKRLEQLIVDEYNRLGSIRAAAAALDVKEETFYGWMVRLGVRIKSVAVAPPIWWNDEEVPSDEVVRRIAT